MKRGRGRNSPPVFRENGGGRAGERRGIRRRSLLRHPDRRPRARPPRTAPRIPPVCPRRVGYHRATGDRPPGTGARGGGFHRPRGAGCQGFMGIISRTKKIGKCQGTGGDARFHGHTIWLEWRSCPRPGGHTRYDPVRRGKTGSYRCFRFPEYPGVRSREVWA